MYGQWQDSSFYFLFVTEKYQKKEKMNEGGVDVSYKKVSAGNDINYFLFSLIVI